MCGIRVDVVSVGGRGEKRQNGTQAMTEQLPWKSGRKPKKGKKTALRVTKAAMS